MPTKMSSFTKELRTTGRSPSWNYFKVWFPASTNLKSQCNESWLSQSTCTFTKERCQCEVATIKITTIRSPATSIGWTSVQIWPSYIHWRVAPQRSSNQWRNLWGPWEELLIFEYVCHSNAPHYRLLLCLMCPSEWIWSHYSKIFPHFCHLNYCIPYCPQALVVPHCCWGCPQIQDTWPYSCLFCLCYGTEQNLGIPE